MDEAPIPDDAEARRLGALLLVGEARVGRLRDRLRQYLQDREPLTLDGLELGFFPAKGRYDAAAVFRAATEAGTDPWPLLAADGRALAAFLKRRPDTEQALAPHGPRRRPGSVTGRSPLRQGIGARRCVRPKEWPLKRQIQSRTSADPFASVKCDRMAPRSGSRNPQLPHGGSSACELGGQGQRRKESACPLSVSDRSPRPQ